jgi:hypothetical protein
MTAWRLGIGDLMPVLCIEEPRGRHGLEGFTRGNHYLYRPAAHGLRFYGRPGGDPIDLGEAAKTGIWPDVVYLGMTGPRIALQYFRPITMPKPELMEVQCILA